MECGPRCVELLYSSLENQSCYFIDKPLQKREIQWAIPVLLANCCFEGDENVELKEELRACPELLGWE